jgi:hypothetical protein
MAGAKIDWHDVLVRAAKTFFQSLAGTAVVAMMFNADQAGLIAACTGAASMAISVVWNAIQGWAASP